MRYSKILLALAVMAVLAMAVSANPNGATVTAGTPETGTASTAGTVLAQGGNITEINLTVESITQRWQGYYGEVSGNITLENAAGDLFYRWNVGTVTGEVYATQDSSAPIWGGISGDDVTAADLDTVIGWSDGADNATNTFTADSNLAIDIMGSVTGASTRDAVYTYTNSTAGTDWQTILLRDGSGTAITDYVFATFINADQDAFNSATADFQLLVPEDHTDGSGSTTYYFYVELS